MNKKEMQLENKRQWDLVKKYQDNNDIVAYNELFATCEEVISIMCKYSVANDLFTSDEIKELAAQHFKEAISKANIEKENEVRLSVYATFFVQDELKHDYYKKGSKLHGISQEDFMKEEMRRMEQKRMLFGSTDLTKEKKNNAAGIHTNLYSSSVSPYTMPYPGVSPTLSNAKTLYNKIPDDVMSKIQLTSDMLKQRMIYGTYCVADKIGQFINGRTSEEIKELSEICSKDMSTYEGIEDIYDDLLVLMFPKMETMIDEIFNNEALRLISFIREYLGDYETEDNEDNEDNEEDNEIHYEEDEVYDEANDKDDEIISKSDIYTAPINKNSFIQMYNFVENQANELELEGDDRVDFVATGLGKSIESYIRGYADRRKDDNK